MAGAKSKPNGLRKRGRGKREASSEETKAESTKKDSVDGEDTTPKTFVEYMKEYKVTIAIGMLVCLPYSLYHTYLFVHLQRPDLLSMMMMAPKIQRPAFGVADARQALIVGTMSSGTTQMAHDLSSKLELEIGHENSETNWSFVRDGTVSWFHGIRFLPRPGIDDTSVSVDIELPTKTVTLEGEQLFKYSVNVLCKELRPNMGFHPFMFRDNGCSFRQSWDSCWKAECKDLLTS